jgi:DHA3 family macrolide efflux protein-like MFS transporter
VHPFHCIWDLVHPLSHEITHISTDASNSAEKNKANFARLTPHHLKNKRALFLLLSANAVSGFAQGISIIAIPWHFIKVLDQENYYGLVYALITFLTLFWSLYAGTLVDRYSRKHLFLGLNIAGFIGLSSVAATGFILGDVPEPLILAVLGLTVFIFNIHYPTLYAFGQEITEPKHYGRTNSLLEVQGQTTSMIAGAFAAFLLEGTGHGGIKSIIPFDVQPWSLKEIFLLDACTYAIAFTLILFIKYRPSQPKKIDTSSFRERFVGGILFLKRNSPLAWFGLASHTVFLILIVQAFFLMSMYVDNHLGQQGVVYASGEILYAGGAILAGFFIRKIFTRINAVAAIIILMVLSVGILYMMAFTQLLSTFFAFCLIMGLCNSGIRILRITFLFQQIPNHIIGRTNSIFNSFNIFMRVVLLLIFTNSFFTMGSNVTYAYFVCGTIVLIAIGPMLYHYQTLTHDYEVKE